MGLRGAAALLAALAMAATGCARQYRATVHNDTSRPVKVEVSFPYVTYDLFVGPRAFRAELAPGTTWDSKSAAKSQVVVHGLRGGAFVSVRSIGWLDEPYVKQELTHEDLHWDVRIHEGEDGRPALDVAVTKVKRRQ